MSRTCAHSLPDTLGGIVAPLLAWYDQNARALPWRENTDPYRVWVSEIMLQQTRVETVISYYTRFMRALPTIASLAEADEQELLKLWEGLGYYSRARNLQKAAKKVMADYNGAFPQSYPEILALPGIGEYTAGAIASICFGAPTPAVDGNVLRVITRLMALEEDISLPAVKAKITKLLADVYPKERCGCFTQSLMELGATVCLPRGLPRCDVCPLAANCCAQLNGLQQALPIKAKRPPRKKEQKTVFLLQSGTYIAIRRREPGTLLGGLWELPNVPGALEVQQAQETLFTWAVSALEVAEGTRRKHAFTHVEWEMTSYIVDCANRTAQFVWVTREQLEREIALPSAFRVFLSMA